MSYIPDCRTDSFYNADNLSENDKQFVNGFDYCVENAADNFFDNLDVYFGDDSHIMHVLNEELPDYLKTEYEMEFAFRDGEAETREVKTYADLLRAKLLDHIEMERDELITSMIDEASEGAMTDDV
jgi:hypothetical protein